MFRKRKNLNDGVDGVDDTVLADDVRVHDSGAALQTHDLDHSSLEHLGLHLLAS